MTIEHVLEHLGFSPNEIKVYLALNDHGSTKAGRIAKIANIDRSSCYETLRHLLRKGLVSHVTIGKIKWFQATGPRMLLDFVKNQEQELQSILPELHARHKSAKVEGQVRLFKGIKGVKAIFLDIIRTGKNNCVFGSEGQFGQRMPEFVNQFERLKKENNILTKTIIRSSRKEVNTKNSEYRYLEEVEGSPAVTNIYGNKIAIMVWTDEPEGIVIENPSAAKSYQSYFNVLWKIAKNKFD